ncbi:MAG: type II secretion system protein [Verrucomicrobiota bacterium]|nr:type II secretion system protein [Verrucomicrobiota bacterium]
MKTRSHKKRTFILLELLIAISLSAILLMVLFRFLVSNTRVEQQIEKAQSQLLERQRLQERLEWVLTNVEPTTLENPSFYTEKEDRRIALNTVFHAGIDPDPLYSGPIHARFFLTEKGDFCLTQWPLKKDGDRKEVLLSDVRAMEWEFFALNEQNKWVWLPEWPKKKGGKPVILRLKFWCGIDKNRKTEPNLKLALILAAQEPIRVKQ